MTVFVKKIQNNNRKNEKAYGKWYGRAVMIDEVGIEELATEIQENCTCKRADVLAVLSELGPVIKKYVQKSYKVRIPYLGVFKLGVRSEGVDMSQDYSVAQHVKAVHVNFRPEYTIDKGHSVVEITRGVRVAEVPKNITGIIDTDDTTDTPDQPAGDLIDDQP